jgi:type I restriction-modification system DNA methylase subunit
MTLRSIPEHHRAGLAAIRSGLERIGYRDGLLAEDYLFHDYFSKGLPARRAAMAAFGQLPPSQRTACICVVTSNGLSGAPLVHEFRALGAPIALEIRVDAVVHWRVGHDIESTQIVGETPPSQVGAFLAEREGDWNPSQLLRAKNISFARSPEQLTLFDDDLIPELERHIRRRLEPLMNKACAEAIETYRSATGRSPKEDDIFQLAFWILAGKVFRDRRVRGFVSLTAETDVDEILEKVAEHYGATTKVALLNHKTRLAMQKRLWSTLNFENLSPDVLTSVWENTFVTPETRQNLGIHSTPRSIAEYIVERLPIGELSSSSRTVMEPCSGSGVFLEAAMGRLRELLPTNQDPRERHKYLKDRLVGFEKEPFGVEISRLKLMLADFPNANGWNLFKGDVFHDPRFAEELQQCKIVLCNPPFEGLPAEERPIDSPQLAHKPVGVLAKVLDNIPTDGMIGFVLPHTALDGLGYREVRYRLAQRFSDIEVVSLPQNHVFATAGHPSALLLAHGEQEGQSVRLVHRHVFKDDWQKFDRSLSISREDVAIKSIDDAARSLLLPFLSNVWHSLRFCDTLGSIATVHRGIEWKGKLSEVQARFVSSKEKPGFVLGLPPQSLPFHSFTRPPAAYLNVESQNLRRGQHFIRNETFGRPKVLINAHRKSRGPWRLAAFADDAGLAFYQTFTAVFCNDSAFNTAMAAVLNGPVANAYLATHELRDNTNETLESVPVPSFTDDQLDKLHAQVSAYVRFVSSEADELGLTNRFDILSNRYLKEIDATVLQAYDLPPKAEKELLDFFGDSQRQVPFKFERYFPREFESYFSLAEYLDESFSHASSSAWKERLAPLPDHIVQAFSNVESTPN